MIDYYEKKGHQEAQYSVNIIEYMYLITKTAMIAPIADQEN